MEDCIGNDYSIQAWDQPWLQIGTNLFVSFFHDLDLKVGDLIHHNYTSWKN